MKNKIGYACINLTLESQKISTNRGLRKATFQSKGLHYVSELINSNVRDLETIIDWNHRNGIHNYRMSSDIFPWFTHYKLEDLPRYSSHELLMQTVGRKIKEYGHKVSFHPGQFNCLASPKPDVVEKTVYELDQHSRLMDMLELDQSHFYNINIHVGGTYGDKGTTLARFIENFQKLSEGTKKRLTLENDDSPNGYTVKDLYGVYEQTGIPIVFDTLHHLCNPGDQSYFEAFNMAHSTWTVIPEIHHSTSKKLYEDPTARLSSHSDYIHEKVDTCGKDVYVTFEAKKKELAVLKYIN